jgi:hypothetical protein
MPQIDFCRSSVSTSSALANGFLFGHLWVRMMEALVFGTPYQGRLAHFPPPRPAPPARSVSPTVVAQRRVREEQDAAYQASLQVR